MVMDAKGLEVIGIHEPVIVTPMRDDVIDHCACLYPALCFTHDTKRMGVEEGVAHLDPMVVVTLTGWIYVVTILLVVGRTAPVVECSMRAMRGETGGCLFIGQ